MIRNQNGVDITLIPVSLISHASKVMLKILLNRLTPQAETIIVEEQVGFRPGRSATEQIFSLRILCERYLQHQQDLFHVFVDFKKAFDRVWHAALWSTMKLYNINANLIKVIESLYSKATSAVYYNGSVGEWFRTTVGVRQGCLLSPSLFNIFLERIMADALENHEGSVCIGGRTITNLRFADDIDALAGKDKNIAFSSKIRLMRSLVISIFLYACETWTLPAELEKKIQTTEMRCFRRLLGISYRDHVTNEKVGNRIRQAIGPYDLLTIVKKRKLRWYGHKTRSTGLAKMIYRALYKEGEGEADRKRDGKTT